MIDHPHHHAARSAVEHITSTTDTDALLADVDALLAEGAAALRALAVRIHGADHVRADILAIATELENIND